MRRIILLLLALVLLAPLAASAARAASGDGSLVVSNADGVLTIQLKGVIFGHFDHGRLTVVDYKTDTPNALVTVSGAKMDLKGAKANVVYSGNDVRFLFPSGTFTLKFEGSGIDLSAVGKGSLKATGKSALDDNGTVAVNGLKATPLPSVAVFGGSPLAVVATTEKQADKQPDKGSSTSAGSSSGSGSSNGR
jgi:hypothetical protein